MVFIQTCYKLLLIACVNMGILATHGFDMLHVDKFPYQWKQTKKRRKHLSHVQISFVGCSNVCQALNTQLAF